MPEKLKKYFRSELGPYSERYKVLGTEFDPGDVGAAGSRINNSTADALLGLGPTSDRSWAMLLHSLRENYLVAHLCSRGDGFEGILYPEGSLRQYRRCYRDLDMAALCQKAYERSQANEETSVEDALSPNEDELERLFPNVELGLLKAAGPIITSIRLLQGTVNWTRLRQMLTATQIEQLYRLWTQGQKTDFYSSSALEGQFIDASIVAMLSRNELDYNMIARQMKRIDETLHNMSEEERSALGPLCQPFSDYCNMLTARSMQMNLTCFLMIASFSYSNRFRVNRNLSKMPKQDMGIYRNAKDWATLLEKDNGRLPLKLRTAPFLISLAHWFFPDVDTPSVELEENLRVEMDTLKSQLAGSKSFFSVLVERFEVVYLKTP